AAGRGVVVLDPKGDLVADVLDRVPPERAGDVIVLDPADEERPVGLNLLAGAEADAELVTEQVVGIFHSLYRASWGRDWLGIELSADYVKLAQQRLGIQSAECAGPGDEGT